MSSFFQKDVKLERSVIQSMRKSIKLFALLLAMLAALTACVEEDTPKSSSETTTTAQTEALPTAPPSVSALKQMILSAENLSIDYTLSMSAGSQTVEVALRREGHMIKIKKETTQKDGNWTYFTRETVYYDLENNDIYQHDKDGKFYVYKMEEEFDWQETLSTYGLLMSEFEAVFEDEHYVWIEGGKYVAPEEELDKLSERGKAAYKSMTATLGRTKSTITCSREGRSGTLIVAFRNPGVNFPEAQRVGSGVSET